MQHSQGNLKALSKVLARSWTDPNFDEVFRAHPAEVLREYGYTLPSGAKVILHTCTDQEWHLGLPPKPSLEDYSPTRLEAIAEHGVDPATEAPLFCVICTLSATASIDRTLA